MSEWKQMTLSEITTKVTDGAHHSPREYKGGLPMFSVKDMKEQGFNYKDAKTISEDDYNKLIASGCQPEIDDILIAKDGSVLKHIFRVKEKPDYVLLSSIAIVRPNKSLIDPAFLVYSIKEPSTKDLILTNFVGGSGVPRIVLKDFKKVDLLIPDLNTQTAIATVLSRIDDKIDLLQRQNSTLEKMAETLFRQKFVEEANEEWGVEKLGEIANVQNGFAFSSRDYKEFQIGHLEVLKMGHIQKGGGLRTNPKKDFVPRNEKLKRWILNKGDIIMAMTDMKDNVVILGVPAMIDKADKYVLNQRVARISLKSNDKLINNYLLYIQLKDSEFVATLQSKANSGVQVNLSTETIKDCEIIIPPIELQKDIGKTITNLYLKKEQNDSQIKTLTSMLDNLLPKLMNGEATVES